MHAAFPYDYQLDIYDESNNLLTSRPFMEECIPVFGDLKHNFVIVFLDNESNFIEYVYEPGDKDYPDRHRFYKWLPDKYTYDVQLYCKNNEILGIDIDTFDSDEEYKYKKFIINNSDIRIDINNIEKLGNNEDSKRRSLW